MKKIFLIIIVGVLVTNGLGTVALQEVDENKEITKTVSISLLDPIIKDEQDYISIELNEATSYLIEAGEPILPRITKVFKLPFGANIKDVFVEFSEYKKHVLSKEIRPGSPPVIDGKNAIRQEIKSDVIYTSFELYPDTAFSYQTSTGLDGCEHVVFLTVCCYPVRYVPSENMLYYSGYVEITVTYEEPSNPIMFSEDYDLVVIAPSEFEQALQPLIDHKNNHGMNTSLVTLEEIYTDYTEGRDDQEKIKLFIKDAIEEMGIQYVLLVGGLIGQSKEVWYLPVRYTNNHAGMPFESGIISDLYYADIYKDNGTSFEDWDSNGNDIFAEYTTTSIDIIDGSPDVYVGRLACRSISQVNTMVDKIITYESSKADDSWFKNMLLIGGDTYPEGGVDDGYEAEIDTNVSASYMDGFSFDRIWASLGTLTSQKDVEQGFNGGAGFVHMAGHANPSILVTFPPGDVHKEQKITILRIYAFPLIDAYWALFYQGKGIAGFISSLQQPRLPRLHNGEKQPVVVVGGCHNSQFNTTLMNIVHDGFRHAYGWGDYVPKCWSWWLTSKENGGAIATMGNTGLGMGLEGFDYPNGLDGWLFPRFFYNYGQLDKHYVGEAYSAAINDYVNEFDINTDMEDRLMVEQWALLGDPSLMIGGYE